MSDFFQRLGQSPRTRRVIRSAGLPIPIPHELPRQKGPLDQLPLHDRAIVVAGGPPGPLSDALADSLFRAGSTPFVVGDDGVMRPYAASGEAYGRHAAGLPKAGPAKDFRTGGLVVDATGYSDPAALIELYRTLHTWLPHLAEAARIVIVARPPNTAPTASLAAAQSALEGLVRSLAKEVGKRGTTCNLIYVEPGAELGLDEPLNYLLTERSAFVTGQPLRVRPTPLPVTLSARSQVLEGKVALVTGAARGIGMTTAKRLAEEGARVICLDRPEDHVATSALARDIGGSALLQDLSAPSAAEYVQREIKRRFGGVDILVHNAGITRDKLLRNMSETQFHEAMQVNLSVVLDVTHTLVQDGLRDGGRVVCLSSIAGIAGNAGQTNYAAAKAGLIGYVEHLAPELIKRGITANAVAPGFIETRMTAAIPFVIREAARRLSALGQGGRPEDVAEAVLFLCTQGAGGIYGQVLRVCGGAFVGR